MITFQRKRSTCAKHALVFWTVFPTTQNKIFDFTLIYFQCLNYCRPWTRHLQCNNFRQVSYNYNAKNVIFAYCRGLDRVHSGFNEDHLLCLASHLSALYSIIADCIYNMAWYQATETLSVLLALYAGNLSVSVCHTNTSSRACDVGFSCLLWCLCNI